MGKTSSIIALWALLSIVLPACSEKSSPILSDPTHSIKVIKAPQSAEECQTTGAEEVFSANADALFNYEAIPTFDFYLPPANWETLQENAVEEKYTSVQACFNGYRIGDIGLRFKGSFGTLYGCFDKQGNLTCPRLSLKLNFKKYDKSIQFFGLKRLNLNTNRFDDSHMREKLAYDLYRDMGIVAPRAHWAKVRVNGKSYGLYGMVEQIDKKFVADRWPESPSGNLFKEVWGTDTNKEAVIKGLRTNKDSANIENFLSFAKGINAAKNDAEVLAVLKHYSDLDYWARYMAVDEAILSYDGLIYFHTEDGSAGENHNFFIYEDKPRHFTLIPWDVESTFWINPDHAPPHWTVTPDDCSSTYPYWEGKAIAPGCDPILKALASDRKAWHQAMHILLDGPFAEKAMLAKIDRYAALIRESVQGSETPVTYISFDQAVHYLRTVIPQLRMRMEAFIAEESEAESIQ